MFNSRWKGLPVNGRGHPFHAGFHLDFGANLAVGTHHGVDEVGIAHISGLPVAAHPAFQVIAVWRVQ